MPGPLAGARLLWIRYLWFAPSHVRMLTRTLTPKFAIPFFG